MTEASPVTHVGYLQPDFIVQIDRSAAGPNRMPRMGDFQENLQRRQSKSRPGSRANLVMRGPQFMLGYWNEPQATAAVLRDGWYWSGDIVMRDERISFCSRPPQRNDQVQGLPGRTCRSGSLANGASGSARLRRRSAVPIIPPARSSNTQTEQATVKKKNQIAIKSPSSSAYRKQESQLTTEAAKSSRFGRVLHAEGPPAAIRLAILWMEINLWVVGHDELQFPYRHF